MNDSWVMRIPKAFIKGYKRGDIGRYGSILKDVKTGKIVGHLAETPNFLKGLSNINISGVNIGEVSVNFTKNIIQRANPVQLGIEIINTISGAVANYQLYEQGKTLEKQSQTLAEHGEMLKGLINIVNRQTDLMEENKMMLKQVLQQLSHVGMMTNIGAYMGVATFGLCIVKFSAITNRLGEVDKKLDDILVRLDLLEESIKKHIEEHFKRQYVAELQTAFDHLIPSAAESQITDCMKSCGNAFNFFQPIVSQMLDHPSKINWNDFIFLYNLLALSTMGEIRANIILEQIEPAIEITSNRIKALNVINRKFSPGEIFQYRMGEKLLHYKSQENEFNTLYRVIDTVKENYSRIDSQREVLGWLKNSKMPLNEYLTRIENDEKIEFVLFEH